jgi:hypothetical protein
MVLPRAARQFDSSGSHAILTMSAEGPSAQSTSRCCTRLGAQTAPVHDKSEKHAVRFTHYTTLRYSSTKRAKTPPVDLSFKALVLQQHVRISDAEPHWDKSRLRNCRFLDQVGGWHRFLQGKLLSTASMISWERVPRLHEIMVAGEDLARACNVILAVSDRRVVSGA